MIRDQQDKPIDIATNTRAPTGVHFFGESDNFCARKKMGRNDGVSYTPAEDMLLVQTVCEIAKRGMNWKKIHASFNDNTNKMKRTISSLRNRFQRLCDGFANSGYESGETVECASLHLCGKCGMRRRGHVCDHVWDAPSKLEFEQSLRFAYNLAKKNSERLPSDYVDDTSNHEANADAPLVEEATHGHTDGDIELAVEMTLQILNQTRRTLQTERPEAIDDAAVVAFMCLNPEEALTELETDAARNQQLATSKPLVDGPLPLVDDDDDEEKLANHMMECVEAIECECMIEALAAEPTAHDGLVVSDVVVSDA